MAHSTSRLGTVVLAGIGAALMIGLGWRMGSRRRDLPPRARASGSCNLVGELAWDSYDRYVRRAGGEGSGGVATLRDWLASEMATVQQEGENDTNSGIEWVVASAMAHGTWNEAWSLVDADGDGKRELADPWGHALLFVPMLRGYGESKYVASPGGLVQTYKWMRDWDIAAIVTSGADGHLGTSDDQEYGLESGERRP